MENDLIDRNDLLTTIGRHPDVDDAERAAQVLECILNAPAVDAVPVVRGQNISRQNPVDEFICSECGLVCRDICRYEYDEDSEDESCLEWTFSYCPRCGAKIDKEAPQKEGKQ